MALQYFIYPYFIPYFPFFSTVPIFSFSALNSSLSDNYGGTNSKFRFATDGAGNFGYLDGDDAFVPFSSMPLCQIIILGNSVGYRTIYDINSQVYQAVGGDHGQGNSTYTTTDGKVTFQLSSNYGWTANVPIKLYNAYTNPFTFIDEYPAGTTFYTDTTRQSYFMLAE